MNDPVSATRLRFFLLRMKQEAAQRDCPLDLYRRIAIAAASPGTDTAPLLEAIEHVATATAAGHYPRIHELALQALARA
jgi:hypothetical protein